MKTVKQLAEETFGKTKDGKGLVTLDDAIKFAEIAVEQNKFKMRAIVMERSGFQVDIPEELL